MSQIPYATGPTGGGPGRDEIDFGAIGRAWTIVTHDIGAFLVAGLVSVLPVTVLGGYLVASIFPAYLILLSGDMKGYMSAMQDIQGKNLIIQGIICLITGATWVSLCKLSLGAIRNGKADLQDFWSGFRYAIQGAFGFLFSFILAYFGCFCCVGGPIIMGLMMFLFAEIADGNKNLIEAAMSSIELTKGKLLMAVLFAIVTFLISQIVGGLLVIGEVFTVPFAACMVCVVYCDLKGYVPGGSLNPNQAVSPYPRGGASPEQPYVQPGTPYPPSDQPIDPPAPPLP